MELQHINVKLFLDPSSELDLWEFVPVFHSWIQAQNREELLIDVADYRHVSGGPAIVLLGHDADYSIEIRENRLGIRYNRKTIVAGTNQDRLSQALRSVLKACEKLEDDRRLNRQIQIGKREIKLFINDRLLVPNLQSSYDSVESEIKKFLADRLDGFDFTLHREEDPRNPCGLLVRTSLEFEVEGLLKKLGTHVSETAASQGENQLMQE